MRDTGRNQPERRGTLLAQQDQLRRGLRPAQMFPVGTGELPLPDGARRIATPRGVFHYNPSMTNGNLVKGLSASGRENQLLGLGPFNKDDILHRVSQGEPPLAVVERDSEGNEVKSAIGTPNTAPAQAAAFTRTKLPHSRIAVDSAQSIINGRQAMNLHVGPIRARVAGRTDHVPLNVPQNSYVIPADIVSSLGEGNTEAGFKTLTEMFGEQIAPRGESVPIMAAGGEYVVSPGSVAKIGRGNVGRGHDILDQWVKDSRKKLIRTLKKLPGPKK